MRRRDRLWFSGLVVSLLMAALPAIPAGAATPVRFGARLTNLTNEDMNSAKGDPVPVLN